MAPESLAVAALQGVSMAPESKALGHTAGSQREATQARTRPEKLRDLNTS